MNWQEEYRGQFPVTRACTYLDTAYDCGGTLIGCAAAQRFFDDWNASAARNERGGPGRATLFKTIDETRELLARLVGGKDGAQIAFTRNTNEGINAILQGFDFQPDDNVVTDALEHASVLMPVINVHKTRGVDARIVPARVDGTVSIKELTEAADEHTRMILVSHVQSATGYMIDLKELGTWCKEHGVFLVVDAIQSLGLCPFEADRWGVDAVSASSYKGLCGTNSSAFMYYQPELLKHIWPVFTAAGAYMETDYTNGQWDLICTADDKARKMENSSLDNIGIYIMHDSAQKILDIGIDRIWEHIDTLYRLLYDGLVELGYQPITPRSDGAHAGVLSLKIDDLDAFFQFMRERNICLSISAHSYIRFSIGAFNNRADIETVLQAVAEYVNQK